MLLKSSILFLGVSYATKNLTEHVNDQKERAESTKPTKKPRKEVEGPKIVGWEPNLSQTADDNLNEVNSWECQGNAFYDQDIYNNYDFGAWPFQSLRPWFGSCGQKFSLFHPEVVKFYAGDEVNADTCFHTENYGDRFLNNFWVDTNGYVVLLREKYFNDYDDYVENGGNQNGLDSRPNTCKSMVDNDIMVFSIYCKDEYANNRFSDYDKMNAFYGVFYNYEEYGDRGFNNENVKVTHLDPNISESKIQELSQFDELDVAPGGLSRDADLAASINTRVREDTGQNDFEMTYAIVIEWSRYTEYVIENRRRKKRDHAEYNYNEYYYNEYYEGEDGSGLESDRQTFTMVLVTDDDLSSGCGVKQFKHVIYIYDNNDDVSQRPIAPESLDFIGITANNQIQEEFEKQNWSGENTHSNTEHVFDLDLTLSPNPFTDGSGSGDYTEPWEMQPGVTCGIHSDGTDEMRIVGGENAKSGQFRWQAYYSPCTYEGCSICGATVISNRWLVSAAHCTEGSDVSLSKVYLGSVQRRGGDEYPLDQQIIHENYIDVNQGNDISLLRTEDEIVFNEYVHPACLPAEDACLAEGSQTYVSGFGTIEFEGNVSDQLMYVDVPVVSTSDCSSQYSGINEEKVCAGPVAGGKDSCQGDSGGPLVYRKTGIWYLYGVVSYGYQCAVAGYPGVYARTTSFNDWIFSNTNGEITAHSSHNVNACVGTCSCEDEGTTTVDTDAVSNGPEAICDSVTCQHGGTCVASEDNQSYECQCPGDYFGHHCEFPPPCSSNPCKNGGSCFNVLDQALRFPGGFKCECVEHYHGVSCERWDPCINNGQGNPCLNGGTCHRYNTNWRNTWPRHLQYDCSCRRGWFGPRCEQRLTRVRWPFMGDVHYTTLDGQAFANQGWCSYILLAHGTICNYPSLRDIAHDDDRYYKTTSTYRDFFMVIVDQEPLDSDPTYQIPVSVLNGVDIIVRPQQTPDSLYKFSMSKSYGAGAGVRFYKSDGNVVNNELTWVDLNPNARFVGNYKAIAQNVNIEVEGVGASQVIHISVGCGQSLLHYSYYWHQKLAVAIQDCLFKITYNAMAGTMAVETTEVMKKHTGNKLCGMLGDYDGEPDFDEDSFNDYTDKLNYQMDQEIENYYPGDKKCQFVSDSTIKAGIPIPIDSGSYFHAVSRRKRDTQSMDEISCTGDWDKVRTKCGIIYQSARFGSCGLDKTTYFDGCVFDGCSAPDNLDNFVCEMLSSYVTSCNNADDDLGYSITSWRVAESFSYTYEGNTEAFDGLCAPTCGANQVFHSCAKPACFATTQNCEVDTAACLASTECVEGCFCASGYLQDGDSCSLSCAESEIEQMEDDLTTSDPCASGPCHNNSKCRNVGTTDYECECLDNSWTGKDCNESTDISIEAPIDVLNALLSLNAPSRKKRSTDLDDLLDHGCFCRILDGSRHPAGKPVSDYDRICKEAQLCTKCGVDNAKAHFRYPYLLSISDDGSTYECDAVNNQDVGEYNYRQRQCECDLFHMRRLVQHQTDTGDEITTGDAGKCTANPPATGNPNDIQCCGQPYKYKLYNTNDKQCININGNNVLAPL